MMADARNGDVDVMDHHQEQVRRLSGQRAALMRLELKRLRTPIPTAEQSRTAFRGTLMPKCAMSAVEPIAELRRTSGYVRNVPSGDIR